MRRYDIAARILLVLPTIDLAVTAPVGPVLVQQKSQARGYVVDTASDADTMLGRLSGDLDGLWLELFGSTESHFSSSPEEPQAARPSSSSQPLVPTEESTNAEQPVPSVQNEESGVACWKNGSQGAGNEPLPCSIVGKRERYR